jgi:hypothetical protein
VHGDGQAQGWDAVPPGEQVPPAGYGPPPGYAPSPGYGAAQLLRRRPPALLFGSALAAVGVLLLTLLVGSATLGAGDRTGLTVFLLLAAPLPVLTAVYARLGRVTGWAAAPAGGPLTGGPFAGGPLAGR